MGILTRILKRKEKAQRTPSNSTLSRIEMPMRFYWIGKGSNINGSGTIDDPYEPPGGSHVPAFIAHLLMYSGVGVIYFNAFGGTICLTRKNSVNIEVEMAYPSEDQYPLRPIRRIIEAL